MTDAATLRQAVGEIAGANDLLLPILGPLVRQIRLDAGVTQRELARRWGVRRGWLSDWERGQAVMSTELLSTLAERWDYLLDAEA